MSAPIKAGMWVEVAKWPHGCVNPLIPIGHQFMVRDIVTSLGTCAKCHGKIVRIGSRSATGATAKNASIPTAWLIRIDPPAPQSAAETGKAVAG